MVHESYLGNVQIKIWCQRCLYNLNVVNLGANLVHAVGRWCDQNVVFPWFAENSHQQINGLIGSDTNKDVGGLEVVPAFATKQLLELALVGIGISLEGVGVVVGIEGLGRQRGWTKGVFVSVQQNSIGVIVTGAAVGLELEDVGTGQSGGNSCRRHDVVGGIICVDAIRRR